MDVAEYDQQIRDAKARAFLARTRREALDRRMARLRDNYLLAHSQLLDEWRAANVDEREAISEQQRLTIEFEDALLP